MCHPASCNHCKLSIKSLDPVWFGSNAFVNLHLIQAHHILPSEWCSKTQVEYLVITDIQDILEFWNLRNAHRMAKGLAIHPQNVLKYRDPQDNWRLSLHCQLSLGYQQDKWQLILFSFNNIVFPIPHDKVLLIQDPFYKRWV